MSGTRYYTPNQFEVDANGVPLAGAQLFFYVTGTSTPQNTYSDVNLTVPNANPVIADGNGRFGSIFLSPSPAYKVQLWSAPTVDNPTGSQIWSEDPVGPGSGNVPQATAGIIGEVRMFAGLAASVPTGWYLCFGQTKNITDFPAAYSVLGTTWGGDGVTTFGLPDFRGRTGFGVDNMGGAAANRVTSGVSGIAGTTLGASGGDQRTQSHTHTVNDPEHFHAITDPGHFHAEQIGQGSGGSFAGWSFNTSSNAVFGTTTNTETINTGIDATQTAATGITNATYGAGGSQNMPPTNMLNFIIYLGA